MAPSTASGCLNHDSNIDLHLFYSARVVYQTSRLGATAEEGFSECAQVSPLVRDHFAVFVKPHPHERAGVFWLHTAKIVLPFKLNTKSNTKSKRTRPGIMRILCRATRTMNLCDVRTTTCRIRRFFRASVVPNIWVVDCYASHVT